MDREEHPEEIKQMTKRNIIGKNNKEAILSKQKEEML